MMTWETMHRFGHVDTQMLLFVGAATLFTYYFHSLVNTVYEASSERHAWNNGNKGFVTMMFICSGMLTLYAWWPFRQHLWPFAGAALATFLYSAPNLPYKPFVLIRKLALGKTIYLALVWTYATTVLPLWVAGEPQSRAILFFLLHRLFLVYAICILFDRRDIVEDRAKGVRTLATMANEKTQKVIFVVSLLLSGIFASLYQPGPHILHLPVLVLALLWLRHDRRHSEYYYYLVLDGLMMLSALLLASLTAFRF